MDIQGTQGIADLVSKPRQKPRQQISLFSGERWSQILR
jgi:hypothetical protein